MKQQIMFNVKNLKITKASIVYAVEGIRNVFEAIFNFQTSDWSGLAKTAVFENVEGRKETVLLDGDKCDIPNSFFVASGICYVSVFAGNFLVTNKAAMVVVNAGYSFTDGDNDAKNYFEQLMMYFDATNENLKQLTDLSQRYAIGIESIPESTEDNSMYYASQSWRSSIESEAWAHGHEKHPELEDKNAKYYANQALGAVNKIAGHVKYAKKDIDDYAKQKESELKGDTGNVHFAAFKVVNGRLIMYSNPEFDKVQFIRNGSRLFYRLAF